MHTWSVFASTAGHHRAQHTCDCRGRERKHCHLRWLHSCCLVKSELFHRISGDECSTTWLSAAAIGSASSLTAHAVSSLLHSLDGSRRIHLVAVTTTGSQIWHYLDIVHTNGNKLILSLELTEHTWISRDVGGDQISCTLPHIVGKIWSEVQNFQMKDCRLSFQQIEHVFLSLCLGSISVKMCMLEIIL